MSLVYLDRVLESSSTTGTAAYSLAGAITGHQAVSGIGNGNTGYFCAFEVDSNGNASGGWEVFLGTYASAGNTLARTSVLKSTNSNNAVSWSAGTRRIMLVHPADIISALATAQSVTDEATARATADALRALKAGDTFTGPVVIQSTLGVTGAVTLNGATTLAPTSTSDIPLTINAPSGTSVDLNLWQVNGATKAALTNNGIMKLLDGFAAGPSVGAELYSLAASALTRTVAQRAAMLGSQSTGLRLASGWGVTWSSNNGTSADCFQNGDTGLFRTAAATAALGNGTAGNASGTLQLGALVVNGATLGSNKVAVTGPVAILNSASDQLPALILEKTVADSANFRMVGGEATSQYWTGTNPNALGFVAMGLGLAIPGNAAGSILQISSYAQADPTWRSRISIDSTTGNVGIGKATAASARLEIVKTTEQLRLGYDASNYRSTTISSTGSSTDDLTGTNPTFSFGKSVSITGTLAVTSTAGAQVQFLYDATHGGSIQGTSAGNLVFTPIGGTNVSIGSASLTVGADINVATYGGLWSPGDGKVRLTGNTAKTGLSYLYLGPEGNATCSVLTQKAIASIADNTATTAFTVTIPNAAHSASIRVRLVGASGAGGSIGAGESTQEAEYLINVTRTPGVNAVAAIGAVIGQPAAVTVAGGNAVAVSATLGAISGAVGATNTFAIQVTIARAGGTATNHTCMAFAELLNSNATGVTIS